MRAFRRFAGSDLASTSTATLTCSRQTPLLIFAGGPVSGAGIRGRDGLLQQATMTMGDEVRFYRVAEAFGCFSNFAPYPIVIDGDNWPTSEHYFQAQKFVSPEIRERIRSAPSPMRAARLGRSRKHAIRSDWEYQKVEVMRKALLAKFSQHPDILAILNSTNSAAIVEHTKDDSFWGDGGDGSGQNMLGKLLMEVRGHLRGTGHGKQSD